MTKGTTANMAATTMHMAARREDTIRADTTSQDITTIIMARKVITRRDTTLTNTRDTKVQADTKNTMDITRSMARRAAILTTRTGASAVATVDTDKARLVLPFHGLQVDYLLLLLWLSWDTAARTVLRHGPQETAP